MQRNAFWRSVAWRVASWRQTPYDNLGCRANRRIATSPVWRVAV
jgi:hypothetical protein